MPAVCLQMSQRDPKPGDMLHDPTTIPVSANTYMIPICYLIEQNSKIVCYQQSCDDYFCIFTNGQMSKITTSNFDKKVLPTSVSIDRVSISQPVSVPASGDAPVQHAPVPIA